MHKKIISLSSKLDKMSYLIEQDDDREYALYKNEIESFKVLFNNIISDSEISQNEKNICRHQTSYYRSEREYSFLHFMIIKGELDEIKWALKNQWNPNYYPTPKKKSSNTRMVTPVGLASYRYQYKELQILLENGGDPFLKFSNPDKKHLPEWGSTLLYRLMGMPAKAKKLQQDKLNTIKVLIPYYPDLLLKTTSERTIIDNSVDNIGIQEILEEISKREKEFLKETPEMNKAFSNNIKNVRL